jgi:hypothetical protein
MRRSASNESADSFVYADEYDDGDEEGLSICWSFAALVLAMLLTRMVVTA